MSVCRRTSEMAPGDVGRTIESLTVPRSGMAKARGLKPLTMTRSGHAGRVVTASDHELSVPVSVGESSVTFSVYRPLGVLSDEGSEGLLGHQRCGSN